MFFPLSPFGGSNQPSTDTLSPAPRTIQNPHQQLILTAPGATFPV